MRDLWKKHDCNTSHSFYERTLLMLQPSIKVLCLWPKHVVGNFSE